MRRLIAWAFMYSLDGLLPDQDTEYWRLCFGLPKDPAETEQKLEVIQNAYAHSMGPTTYQAMGSGKAATATSWSGAGSGSGGR